MTDWLLQRLKPHFGFSALYTCLALSIYYSVTAPLRPVTERINSLSIFGFIPDPILNNPLIFMTLQMIAIIGAVFWGLRLALPLSPVIATFSYTLLISMSAESEIYAKHMYHFVNMLMVILCAWFLLCKIPRARSLKTLLQQEIQPRWVYSLSLFYICSAYSLSGLTKLFNCGVNWANGSSLQLWIAQAQNPDNPIAGLLLNSYPLALTAQALAFTAELFAILAVPFVKLRRIIGLILVGFHINVELIFDFAFYGNIFLDALVLIIFAHADRAKGQ